MGVDRDCLPFQSVAQICAVLPRRSSVFASHCLVKKLAGQVSEVAEECSSSWMDLAELQGPA